MRVNDIFGKLESTDILVVTNPAVPDQLAFVNWAQLFPMGHGRWKPWDVAREIYNALALGRQWPPSSRCGRARCRNRHRNGT